MLREHTAVAKRPAGNVLDFSPLVGSARGGAAGAFFPGLGAHGRLTARPRRRKKPKSRWTYNEWVYATVEDLWNELSPEQKLSWRFGWKPKCLSARDYFGKWNMVCVYRWGGWVKLPPSQHRVGKVRYRPPELVDLPEEYKRNLGGDFAPLPADVLICEGWRRSGFAYGSSKNNACDNAWAVVMAKPWVKVTALDITNVWYAYFYGWQWGATVYQAYCRLTVPPGVLRVWQPWILEINGGKPDPSAQQVGFWAGGEYLVTKIGTYVNNELGWRTTEKGQVYDCQQKGGWFKPPYPPAASQWAGCQSGLIVPTVYGR